MLVRVREELVSDSEKEKYTEGYRRLGKSLDNKINVDIPDFYGGMYVE